MICRSYIIYLYNIYQLVVRGDGSEYGRKNSSKNLLTAVACFKYIVLFFKLVELSCMLHIVSMTLTTREEEEGWCCIGVKCSSAVLPAGNYAMYVGLGCLSTTTVGVFVCVCVRIFISI